MSPTREGDPILVHTPVTATEKEPKLWMPVLHGIFGSGRNWGGVARQLVETRPEWGVLLTDLRLHGGSVDFAPPHTLDAAANDVASMIEAKDLNAGAMLGHSFGGKVALAYARQHPEDLRQVWVVDSTLEAGEPSGSAWDVLRTVQSLPSEFGSRDELVKRMEDNGYERSLGHWLAANLERDDNVFRWRLDWEGAEAMLRDYFRADLWEVIESPPGQMQIHVVRGTRSDALGPRDIERLERAGRESGRVFLHEIEAGHWVNAENPEAIVKLLSSQLP